MVLERVTGVVFAGNAALTNLGEFGSAADGQGINPTNPVNPTDPSIEEQIQTPAYEDGWTEAVVTTKNFPPIEEVNGVLRTISHQACYLLQEGIAEWDANTVYSNTSIVKSINGNELSFYISQVDGQSGHIPEGDDGTYWVKAIITGDREIGVPQITLDFTSTLPSNCIDLLGQEEPIAGDFAQLYSIYGTTYNNGTEAAGKFRLPDFRDRVFWGGDSAGYIDAGLPNIIGNFGRVEDPNANGAFTLGNSYNSAAQGSGDNQRGIHFEASDSNSIYGNSATVQPPAIKVRVYTRYK